MGGVASALISAATVQAAPVATRTIVHLPDGQVRGTESDRVVAFKGIPYAAPPIGALRWRAPQPVKPWSGLLDGTSYRNDCMQVPFPSDAAPLGTPPAEDCLFANVWKPVQARGRLPVMVWIYGGGFVNGGASPPTYSGEALAKRGILVISFNYRVGRFGVFAHPQITKANADHGLLTNYGYMDQIALLRWVQRNAASFGGDPRNVTIVGESAGGSSVHVLIASPLTKGLFQRAAVMSGNGLTSRGGSTASAEAAGIAFARSKGIDDTDPEALNKLRALPAETITDGLNMQTMSAQTNQTRTFVGPVVDGTLNVDPTVVYRTGKWPHVPLMVGATNNDAGGPNGPLVNGTRQIADLMGAQKVPTYYYRFSYVADSVRTPTTIGATHASDVPYFFDRVDQRYGSATTDQDRRAAKVASTLLANFVRTGDPSHGLPFKWPVHDARNGSMLEITSDAKTTVLVDQEKR